MRIFVALASVLWAASCSDAGTNSQNTGSEPETSTPKSDNAPAIAARNGPFGLELGQSLESVGEKTELKPGVFRLADVPKPHADMEYVVVVGYPQTGICTVRGIGRTLENDGSGTLVRTKVDELASALATKYGKPAKNDFCVGGDIQCEDQFWMMTLNGNERVYGYEWKASDRLTEAKLDSIVMGAQAQDIRSSWVVLEYHGTNRKACDAAEKAATAESL